MSPSAPPAVTERTAEDRTQIPWASPTLRQDLRAEELRLHARGKGLTAQLFALVAPLPDVTALLSRVLTLRESQLRVQGVQEAINHLDPGSPTGFGPRRRGGPGADPDGLRVRVHELENELRSAQAHLARLGMTRLSPQQELMARRFEARYAKRSLTVALEQRDAALERADDLEALLRAQGLPVPEWMSAHALDRRETWSLLLHFRKRLRERFHLTLSLTQIRDLNEQVRTQSVLCQTQKGADVKYLELDGHRVYAVLRDDDQGHATLTSAYTLDMVRRAPTRKDRRA